MTDAPDSLQLRDRATLRLAVATVAANALVILQGAFVRVTGSGAGCGRHWPLCNGEIVPLDAGIHTVIEFNHRLLSLAVLILGAWLFARVWRDRRRRPGLFVATVAATAFLLVEALLGALTVLWGLTGDNTTVARGLMVATHLVNSLLLVGSLTAVWLYARPRPPAWPLRLRRQGALSTVLLVGLVGMLFLMFTGGIAAMGNTMFPSASLAEGFAADLDPNAHPLIRLRVLHPLIAVTVGLYLFLSLGTAWWLKPAPEGRGLAQVLFGTYLAQLAVGTVNLVLLGPIALQLLHLGLAVVAFGLLTALAVTLLAAPVARAKTPETARLEPA
ncbi:MAG: COX15/CtaA family protein [Trueperaceae bacterium]|nr:COX15/CtaA family protein [Trueperaceae bacterium]